MSDNHTTCAQSRGVVPTYHRQKTRAKRAQNAKKWHPQKWQNAYHYIGVLSSLDTKKKVTRHEKKSLTLTAKSGLRVLVSREDSEDMMTSE